MPYKAKVLNTATGGMGPFDYLTEMRTKGISFKPDIVLLFYYVGNDLADVQYNRQNLTNLKNRLKNFLRPLFKKLYIYNFYIEKKIYYFRIYLIVQKCKKEE